MRVTGRAGSGRKRRVAERIEALWRQLAAMAELQQRHNRLVHRAWQQQDFPFYRAVWVECAELLDHYGWKWWKQEERALDQAKLEVVDIWHFGLSALIQAGQVDRALARRLLAAWDAAPAQEFRLAVEALACSSLATRGFDTSAFVAVMRALPLGFDELHRLYAGKNVLNAFRQRNGYRTGGYRRVWAGREDNVHLVELAAGLDADAADYPAKLTAALAARYAATSPSAASDESSR